MCIPYNGIEYHHGFSVTKPTRAGIKQFDILVTKHTENQPYRYSALCLNSDYQVCTKEYGKPAALIELFEKIVGDTLAAEREHPLRYPGESFMPIMNVQKQDQGVYSDYSDKMKNALSLEEYDEIHNDLKPYLEKSLFGSRQENLQQSNMLIPLSKRLEEMIMARQFDAIYDCKDMYLTLHFVKGNETLKDCEIKYTRV